MKNRGLLLVTVAAAALLLMPPPVPPEDAEDEPDYQAPDWFDQAGALVEGMADMLIAKTPREAANEKAFLWMIRVSEGTSGPNGYQTMVGGGLFSGYADHPRRLVDLPNLGIKSSAAGAYQILRRTWDGVRAKIGARDFSPAWQDLAALELIRQRGALADVRAGRFSIAVEKCKKEWASLPGAGYGQHENSLAKLQAAYTSAGGVLA